MKEPKTRNFKTSRHLSIALSHFEQLSADELSGVFYDKPATEIREYIAELRTNGYEYLPCSCDEHNADGSCKGWAEDK